MVERRANAFAAAFLMPGAGIRASLRSLDKGQPSRQEHAIFDPASGGRTVAAQRTQSGSQRITFMDNAELAHRFGVGYRAVAYRLKSLRHISDRECSGLLERERLGQRHLKMRNMLQDIGECENQRYWDRELRSEVAYLAIEAYRRDEISRGRVLELSKSLRVSGDTLLNLAEAARGE